MANPPPVVRIAGHERLGQEVQRRAVDDHPRPADGVDHRTAGGVAHDVALAALGPVEERLAHVAVDDQLAALGDLAELVLGVAVDVGLQPVHARGEVVAGIVVAVHAQAVGGRAEARGVETRAARCCSGPGAASRAGTPAPPASRRSPSPSGEKPRASISRVFSAPCGPAQACRASPR